MSVYKLSHVAQIIGGEKVYIDIDDRMIFEVDHESEVDFHGMKLWTIQALAARQKMIQEQLDILKKISTRLQKELDTIRLNLLPEKMDAEEITNITIADVGRVTIQSDIYFSIPAEKREEAYTWLKEHGHGDLVQETVNSSSAKAWAKEMLKKSTIYMQEEINNLPDMMINEDAMNNIKSRLISEGKAIPMDIFKVSPFSRAQITKSAKK